MATQEEEWEAGRETWMGKGKYFVAGSDVGTGTIFGADGSIIQQNVRDFSVSDPDANGVTEYSYTTDTGSRRYEGYGADGSRRLFSNHYRGGKSEASTVLLPSGDVSHTQARNGTVVRDEVTGSDGATVFDALAKRREAERASKEAERASKEAEARKAVGRSDVLRRGVALLRDERGRLVGAGGADTEALERGDLRANVVRAEDVGGISAVRGEPRASRTKRDPSVLAGTVLGNDGNRRGADGRINNFGWNSVARTPSQSDAGREAAQGTAGSVTLPDGVTKDRWGRYVRNGIVLSGRQLRRYGLSAADKGGKAAERDSALDALVADLEGYGPPEPLYGETELDGDDLVEYDAARTRARDAGKPVDDPRYRRDEESGKVYRKWSRFDLSDGERAFLGGGGDDAETAAIRAMLSYTQAGGRGARDIRDIRALAWNLRRNRKMGR